jgi:hypothetical protein
MLGLEHPDTLRSMSNLASVAQEQGRAAEAEGLHRQVLKLTTKVLGPEHPDTLRSMSYLALTLHDLRLHDDAVVLMLKCYQKLKEKLGAHHPHTQKSLVTIISWKPQDCDGSSS